MQTEFRRAAQADLEKIFYIYKKGIANMIASGIYQWDEIYPTIDDINSDIAKGEMYVLLKDGNIVSAVVCNEKADEEYKTGGWRYTRGRICIFHRLCVDPACQKQGVGSETIGFLEQKARELGYSTVYLDTFSQNPFALRLYEKLGYTRAGEIRLRKGLFYLFEKELG